LKVALGNKPNFYANILFSTAIIVQSVFIVFLIQDIVALEINNGNITIPTSTSTPLTSSTPIPITSSTPSTTTTSTTPSTTTTSTTPSTTTTSTTPSTTTEGSGDSFNNAAFLNELKSEQFYLY